MGIDKKKIEEKWQKRWRESELYTPDLSDSESKFYNLWMFPYPSGEGLHAGHAFASTGSDVYGRYMRMKGRRVFQPIGYDSFGIHSENFALKTGEHPSVMLERTKRNYKKQLSSLGHGYDWTRTVTTSDMDYYRWTQWLFVELFKAGLAYRKKAKVNWCPSCKTVLSDEQVINGECERCGSEVVKKDLEQWFFRITDYADRLLGNLDKIDWSARVVAAQRSWIGKKEGININYKIKGLEKSVTCFTTRPDTNFGATFVVLSPEVAQEYIKVVPQDIKEDVSEYIKNALNRSEQDRLAEGKRKTGKFMGIYAVNPLNDYEMPVWVADFVLADVGTGAVVGVPGHDKRDFEFAQEFDLPIKRVVVDDSGDESEISSIEQVQEEAGVMVNSGFLDGKDIGEAKAAMMDRIEEDGYGERTYNYHLRDWLISRQRYWGPPIPVIYCEKCAKDGKGWLSENEPSLRKKQPDWDSAGWYPEENLPVELPHLEDYEPEGTGRGPLAEHPEFYETKCPGCGEKAVRETDVSDTFLDSSWYFLRYPSVGSAGSEELPFVPEVTEKWLPVDLYFGGAEHSVLHLMYARFVTQVLYDLGVLPFEEPFPKFFAHGLMIKDGAKMSKSRGNVVNPDEYIEKFGADTLRLYTMFLGPMDGSPDFRDEGIEGMSRFIDRVWSIYTDYDQVFVESQSDSEEILRKMHQTVKKVTQDMESFSYNTAIASIMEFVNLLREKALKSRNAKKQLKCAEWNDSLRCLVKLLAPFAPHMAEEIWVEKLGEEFSVHTSAWPEFDESLAQERRVTIPIQVNGKLRGSLEVDNSKAEDKAHVVALAKKMEGVSKYLDGKKVKRSVFVPGRLVNFVV